MHESVLESHVDQLRGGLRNQAVQGLAHADLITIHLLPRRPVGGNILGQTAFIGIDSEREEAVEFGVETRRRERPLPDQIPVESLQVAEVKNQAMAFRNRPFVEGIGTDQIEQFVGALSRALQFNHKIGSGAHVCNIQ